MAYHGVPVAGAVSVARRSGRLELAPAEAEEESAVREGGIDRAQAATASCGVPEPAPGPAGGPSLGGDDQLQTLLGRALPDPWDKAPRGGSMTARRPSGRSRPAPHVSPVGDGSADFGGRRVAALVLAVDPERRPRVDAARVAAVLGLTPSESRAAALPAEGRSVPEIAAATGWRASCVRRLPKRIYRKQGISVSLVPRVLAVEALPRD